MNFFEKAKLLVMFFIVLFLGGVFLKNGIVIAREAEDSETIYNSDSSYSTNSIIPSYPSNANFKFSNATVGGIFSALLPYVYTVAGLILLFMLIIGGFGLMTAAGDPKKIEASKGRITAALIGFLIVFVSYLVVQLVQIMLNVQIL